MSIRYDEDKKLSLFWSWVIIIAFSTAIIVYGCIVYFIVSEGVREWDFGQLPDTPAEGIFSSQEPTGGAAKHRQLPRLPEAEKKLPPKSRHEPLRERSIDQ